MTKNDAKTYCGNEGAILAPYSGSFAFGLMKDYLHQEMRVKRSITDYPYVVLGADVDDPIHQSWSAWTMTDGMKEYKAPRYIDAVIYLIVINTICDLFWALN
jgi:hypothetical protein